MTEDEFLALPDDGIERWLIDGKVMEFGEMTKRNRFHSVAMARITKFLDNWLDTRPEMGGEVLCGEAGVCLPGGKVVGVDVAYVSAVALQNEVDESTIIVGTPTLIVEILSPSDKNETWKKKLGVYSTAAVPIVWKVDPDDRTVTVYRHGQPPLLFNETQELTAEPELPGFHVRVADLFGR